MSAPRYIAGIASFAGAINNVKADADNGKLTIKIDGKDYTLESNKIENFASINNIDNLLQALEGAKADIKDNESKPFSKTISKELYFVKSIEPAEGSTNGEFKMDDKFAITLTAAKAAKIELVKKEDRVNIKYDDTAVKGARLTKENEKIILANILQGRKNSEILTAINSNVSEFKFGGEDQTNNAKVIGSNEINLFEGEAKIDFEIKKIEEAGLKTVVCTFNGDVESKLVKGINLEELCKAADITTKDKKLSEEITALNNVAVENMNKSIFKNDANLDIFANGFGGTKLVGDSAKIPADCKFILINNIKETDINPIFLKKEFKVEFDNEGNNTKKVEDTILNKIKEALNTKFRDTVAIKVSDITDTISGVKNSTDNDIIVNNAFNNLNVISIEGVKKATDNLTGTDLVNSKDITVKLKSAVFAKDIVKTEINLNCDLTNVKKGDKVLTGDVKNIISPILNKTLTEVTAIKDIIDALNAALSGKFENDSKKIEAIDFDFSAVSSDNTNIKNSGAITIKDSFANKLKDDCFETEKEQGDNDQNKNKNSEGSEGTNGDGGNQNEGNKDQKGYCGSNKK